MSFAHRRPTTVLAHACIWLLVGLSHVPGARAGGGPLGIDHRLTYDNSGIWARSNQDALIDILLAGTLGGALWEGGETRIGRTVWQSVDSGVIGGVSSTVLKYVFSRERPSQTSDPDRWFTGHGQSFPSGEVTFTASIITPYVLEYRKDYPAVYALELLPIYDSIARMKVWGHWQTDVIAGFALGTASGYIAHQHEGTPWVLSVMPHAIYVGLKKQF